MLELCRIYSRVPLPLVLFTYANPVCFACGPPPPPDYSQPLSGQWFW